LETASVIATGHTDNLLYNESLVAGEGVITCILRPNTDFSSDVQPAVLDCFDDTPRIVNRWP
jgi:hypothetical protein